MAESTKDVERSALNKIISSRAKLLEADYKAAIQKNVEWFSNHTNNPYGEAAATATSIIQESYMEAKLEFVITTLREDPQNGTDFTPVIADYKFDGGKLEDMMESTMTDGVPKKLFSELEFEYMFMSLDNDIYFTPVQSISNSADGQRPIQDEGMATPLAVGAPMRPIFNTVHARRVLAQHIESLQATHDKDPETRRFVHAAAALDDADFQPLLSSGVVEAAFVEYAKRDLSTLSTLSDDHHRDYSLPLLDLSGSEVTKRLESIRVNSSDIEGAVLRFTKNRSAAVRQAQKLLPSFRSMVCYRETMLAFKEVDNAEVGSMSNVSKKWAAAASHLRKSSQGMLPGHLTNHQPVFLPLRIAAPPRVGKSAIALLTASLAVRLKMVVLYSVSPNKILPVKEIKDKLKKVGWADNFLDMKSGTEINDAVSDVTGGNRTVQDIYFYSSDEVADIRHAGEFCGRLRKTNHVVLHIRDEAQSLAKKLTKGPHSEFAPVPLELTWLRAYYGNEFGLNCLVTATHWPTLLEEDMWGFIGSTQQMKDRFGASFSQNSVGSTTRLINREVGAHYLPLLVPALCPAVSKSYAGVFKATASGGNKQECLVDFGQWLEAEDADVVAAIDKEAEAELISDGVLLESSAKKQPTTTTKSGRQSKSIPSEDQDTEYTPPPVTTELKRMIASATFNTNRSVIEKHFSEWLRQEVRTLKYHNGDQELTCIGGELNYSNEVKNDLVLPMYIGAVSRAVRSEIGSAAFISRFGQIAVSTLTRAMDERNKPKDEDKAKYDELKQRMEGLDAGFEIACSNLTFTIIRMEALQNDWTIGITLKTLKSLEMNALRERTDLAAKVANLGKNSKQHKSAKVVDHVNEIETQKQLDLEILSDWRGVLEQMAGEARLKAEPELYTRLWEMRSKVVAFIQAADTSDNASSLEDIRTDAAGVNHGMDDLRFKYNVELSQQEQWKRAEADLNALTRDHEAYDTIRVDADKLDLELRQLGAARTIRGDIAHTAEDSFILIGYLQKTTTLIQAYVERFKTTKRSKQMTQHRQNIASMNQLQEETKAVELTVLSTMRLEFGLLILLFCSVLNPKATSIQDADKAPYVEDNLGLRLVTDTMTRWHTSKRKGHVLAYLYDPCSLYNKERLDTDVPEFVFDRFDSAGDALDWAWESENRQIGKCAILGYNMLQAGLTLQHTKRDHEGKQRRYLPNYVACKTAPTTSLDTTLQVVGRSFVDFHDVYVPSTWKIKLLGVEGLCSELKIYQTVENKLASVGDTQKRTFQALLDSFSQTNVLGESGVAMSEHDSFDVIRNGTLGSRGVRFQDLLTIFKAVVTPQTVTEDSEQMEVGAASASQWGNHPWVMEGRVSQLASLMASVARISGAARS